MKPTIFYLATALICLGVFATLSTLKWLKDQTRREQIRPEVEVTGKAYNTDISFGENGSIQNSIHLHKGDVFYIRWGYPEDIRVYKCVDINSKGYYVKWRDAGELDSHSIEFMPINIIDNPAFKLISQDTVNDMDTAKFILEHSEIKR